MKRKLLAAAAISAFALTASAQGYGPGYGMGSGMRGGYGPGDGYGMGPGMMQGYGGPRSGGYGYGMGPGMMWGYGGGPVALDLSAEQRKKIDQIEEETAEAQWKLMGTMHQQRYQMYNQLGPDGFDEQAARKAYQAMADARKAMFELSLESRKRIDAVLTKEQREKLRRGWGSR
jgi:Spy/CpxP family protein refolding chaperone